MTDYVLVVRVLPIATGAVGVDSVPTSRMAQETPVSELTFLYAGGSTYFTVRAGNNTNSIPDAAAPTGTIARFLTERSTAVNGRIVNEYYGPSLTSGPTFSNRRALGTAVTPLAISNTAVMGSFNAIGYGATGFATAAGIAITAKAAEDWTDSAQGTRWTFSTTPKGSTTLTEALTIEDSGAFTSTPLKNSTTYADDAAAAVGGVAVGQMYRNGSVVMIRIASFLLSLLLGIAGANAQGQSTSNMVRGSGSSTGTSATDLTGMAAPGPGVSIYITSVTCFRTDAGTSTSYVTLNDSASTTIPLPVGSGAALSPQLVPLLIAANTKATFTPHDALSTVFCNAQGYTK